MGTGGWVTTTWKMAITSQEKVPRTCSSSEINYFHASGQSLSPEGGNYVPHSGYVCFYKFFFYASFFYFLFLLFLFLYWFILHLISVLFDIKQILKYYYILNSMQCTREMRRYCQEYHLHNSILFPLTLSLLMIYHLALIIIDLVIILNILVLLENHLLVFLIRVARIFPSLLLPILVSKY